MMLSIPQIKNKIQNKIQNELEKPFIQDAISIGLVSGDSTLIGSALIIGSISELASSCRIRLNNNEILAKTFVQLVQKNYTAGDVSNATVILSIL